MLTPYERVLLVEKDPNINDLIVRQTLQPMGYMVEVVESAASAIQAVIRFSPDVIIANLDLPGLSGKDLLVALSSQRMEAPVIVLAKKGMEGDVIQAFRLGAADYLLLPIREAEVVSAVERVLKQVRARREREQMARQLNQINQELQQRVRGLTTILSIGKVVTSVTDQRQLLDKILEGAVYVSEADCGWILLRQGHSKTFLLSAYRNLPASTSAHLNQPWDDGISTLVALSGETLSIQGEPLKQFKVAKLGQAALVIPIKAKREVIGLLVIMRKAPQPFSSSNQTLVEAVADYASISLVNTGLFRTVEERAQTLEQAIAQSQMSERSKNESLQDLNHEIKPALGAILGSVGMLLDGRMGVLGVEQNTALQRMKDNLLRVQKLLDTRLQSKDNHY